MIVNVETRHVSLPRNNREGVTDRAARIFSRLSEKVNRLRVTLQDINGPRGGCDKVCMVRANLVGGGEVVVVDRASEMGVALDNCLRRAKIAVTRELKQRRRHKAARRRSDDFWSADPCSESH